MKIIYQELKKEIENYLKPFTFEYAEERFNFEIINYYYNDNIDLVEVYGYFKNEYEPEKQTRFILLRFYINNEFKQIQISNIFLPDFMQHKGIGKKLIYKIFIISEKEQYEVFVVNMVNHFYQSLIKRGALPCNECDDAVQIIDKTKLF